MNFNDVFRSLFGLQRRGGFKDLGSPNEDDVIKGDGYEEGGNIFIFGPFPFSGGGGGGNRHGDEHQDNDHGNIVPGFGIFDMHRHFEDAFKQVEQMFENFGQGGFPFEGKVPFGGQEEGGSLRDKMLKEPDSDQTPRQPRMQPPAQSEPFLGRNFGSSEFERGSSTSLKYDTDLDDEIIRGNLDAILGPRNGTHSDGYYSSDNIQPSPRMTPKPYQSYKSVSVRTYKSGDGRVEERRTIQDGRGNKETTVIREIDGQRHTVTKRSDHTGSQDVRENFDNLDQGEKGSFDHKWDDPNYPGHIQPKRGLFHDRPDLDPHTRSIFQNLFGKSFPGFSDDS